MSDGAEKYRRLLSAAVENISNAFYDAYVEVNCRVRYMAGLKVTVIREELGDCCNWCKDLAGVYSYESAPKDVYARHANCKCMVTTKTEKGVYQDAWSRDEYHRHKDARIAREEEIQNEINGKWTIKEKRAKIKTKRAFADQFFDNPQILSKFTPKGLKMTLETEGYTVIPLGRGSLKGELFENGGGYRTSWGGDRYLQFHPAKNSHHRGAYYKISSGEDGTRWFYLNGDEFFV